MRNRLSEFLYGEKALEREPVTLLDIGCSGGVESEWDVFGSSLRAIGFDPLEFEIARLRRIERRPHVGTKRPSWLEYCPEKEREGNEDALSEADKFYPTCSPDRAHARRWRLFLRFIKEEFNSGATKSSLRGTFHSMNLRKRNR